MPSKLLTVRQPLPHRLRELSFLRRRIVLIAAGPIACLLLVLLLWLLLVSKVTRDREHIEQGIFHDAHSLTSSFAAQIVRSVEYIDQISLRVRYDWLQSRGTMRLEPLVEEGIYPGTAQIYVTVFDRDGKAVTSTRPFEKDFRIRFPPLFEQHRNDPDKSLKIGLPAMGKRTPQMLVRFTRRLVDQNNDFAGVVSVAVTPSYLTAFYAHGSIGEHGFLSVAGRDDGVTRALANDANSDPVAASGNLLGANELMRLEDTRKMGKETFKDQRARVVGWKALNDYPLVAVVGLSYQDALADQNRVSADYYRIAIAITLLMVITAVVWVSLIARLAWRRHQAQKVKETYRLATDGAREGFYMVRALYDDAGTVADFLVEDCNDLGAKFVGHSRESLIGKRYSDLYFGAHAIKVLEIFRDAMRSGFYEDEFQVSPDSPLRAKWMHRRIVRSEDGLAMTVRDVSDAKAQEQALDRMANHDALTSLPNRHWLMNFLPGALERATRQGSMVALLFIDLDDFKNINDTLGHAAGDELLRVTAVKLRALLRPGDNVVRLGGDEFTVVLEDVTSGDDGARVAQRIVRTLAIPTMLTDQKSHTVSCSIGISMFPYDGGDAALLLKHADIAMYAAKTGGKARYEFFRSHMSDALVERIGLEQALAGAIERDELVIHYQPRVDAFTGELRGMEALVRWSHPEKGLVPPANFIELAESTGLIDALGALVIQKVCGQMSRWQAAGLTLVPVSINVSPRQCKSGNVSEYFSQCIGLHALDASLLQIEITESSTVVDEGSAAEELAALQSLGIKLLVDDFGTGYSSLSQLQRLQLDGIKIDKAFTSALGTGVEAEVIFRAILSMAEVLGMDVVAEGVETAEQLAILRSLGCPEVQGFYIAAPTTDAGMAAFLEKPMLLPSALRAISAT